MKRQWLERIKARGDKCFWCGSPGEHTHHIAKGARRIDIHCNLIRLCGSCHHQIHNDPRINIIHEYAIKALGDPDEYNRVMLNNIRGRADNAVSEVEVIQAAMELGLVMEK